MIATDVWVKLIAKPIFAITICSKAYFTKHFCHRRCGKAYFEKNKFAIATVVKPKKIAIAVAEKLILKQK